MNFHIRCSIRNASFILLGCLLLAAPLPINAQGRNPLEVTAADGTKRAMCRRKRHPLCGRQRNHYRQVYSKDCAGISSSFSWSSGPYQGGRGREA